MLVICTSVESEGITRVDPGLAGTSNLMTERVEYMARETVR